MGIGFSSQHQSFDCNRNELLLSFRRSLSRITLSRFWGSKKKVVLSTFASIIQLFRMNCSRVLQLSLRFHLVLRYKDEEYRCSEYSICHSSFFFKDIYELSFRSADSVEFVCIDECVDKIRLSTRCNDRSGISISMSTVGSENRQENRRSEDRYVGF